MSVAGTLVPIGPQPVDTTQNEIVAIFKLAFTGSYVANGDALTLSESQVPSTRVPSRVEIYEQPPIGTAPTGYSFLWAQGTPALPGGGVQVLVGGAAVSTPAAQLAVGAYPGALTGTNYIYARAFFPSY